VIIADDEPILREALGDIIASHGEFEVVAVAGDAGEATRLAREHRPRVALIDVRMPGGGGVAAAEGIRESSPDTRIVALSAYDDEARISAMRGAGAVAYILKGAPAEDIVGALLRAASA
jgi:DNA-binding NarL/FixJ family response regulator